MQLGANDVLKLISRDVVALCVHMNQLKDAAIKIPIQEVIVELEHSQFCQLIHSDSDMKQPIDLAHMLAQALPDH